MFPSSLWSQITEIAMKKKKKTTKDVLLECEVTQNAPLLKPSKLHLVDNN